MAFRRNGGHRPELAWTCRDCADSLVQRNGEGDLAKANPLLDVPGYLQPIGHVALDGRVLFSRRELIGA